ncbi:hypothetical protein [Streptomyces sp. ADI95-16]|uniref:hypothetical protein n=1 Tax=Streptomyces sp. ADI95-16 TaxID=1522758 RepID=UPI001C1FE932|nr:hypothetical protein [Streptomyces sp. ADI95-16]
MAQMWVVSGDKLQQSAKSEDKPTQGYDAGHVPVDLSGHHPVDRAEVTSGMHGPLLVRCGPTFQRASTSPNVQRDRSAQDKTDGANRQKYNSHAHGNPPDGVMIARTIAAAWRT